MELLTVPPSNVFLPLVDVKEFAARAERFRAAPMLPIPVWIGSRADLRESIDHAAPLYDGLRCLDSADLGILASGGLPYGAEHLIRPLARRWVHAADLARFELATPVRLLVVAVYADLDWLLVRPLLLRAYTTSGISLGFLAGRDVPSLLWMIAKQWAQPAQVSDIGFFSAVDRGQPRNGVRAYGKRELESMDIQQVVLQRCWRRILFQGHGKDDSINLAEFTICGRNEAISPTEGALRPRCGYGWPCYKDDTKLIPLRRVRAVEVILSACNSGPIAGLALYDPKYILLLNAIDGCAQTVVSAVTVQDSAEPENRAWAAAATAEPTPSVSLLNRSLQDRHPYPAFWHFGLPPAALAPGEKLPALATEIRSVIERVQSYLVSDLLPPNYPLRRRFERLNQKLNGYLNRNQQRGQTKQDAKRWMRSLWSQVQAVDHTLAERITACPEDDLMNYGSYYGDRSEMWDATVEDVPCSCGYSAQRFERRGFAGAILTTLCVLCLRCGDREFRMQGAPALDCTAQDRIQVGEALDVDATVEPLEEGAVRVGLFVPSYLRRYTRVTSPLQKVRGLRGKQGRVCFSLSFAAEVPPQAYYFTLFAVQNLGVSTFRKHFGIEP